MRRGALRFVLGLALVAAIPIAGHAVRGASGERCAADGVTLVDAPVVRVIEPDGLARSFCCIGCAESWLRKTGNRPSRVTVTDEVSQRELGTEEAWFVQSLVPAQPATLDRVHTFGTREDAERHARSYRGRVLRGEDRPFHGID